MKYYSFLVAFTCCMNVAASLMVDDKKRYDFDTHCLDLSAEGIVLRSLVSNEITLPKWHEMAIEELLKWGPDLQKLLSSKSQEITPYLIKQIKGLQAILEIRKNQLKADIAISHFQKGLADETVRECEENLRRTQKTLKRTDEVIKFLEKRKDEPPAEIASDIYKDLTTSLTSLGELLEAERAVRQKYWQEKKGSITYSEEQLQENVKKHGLLEEVTELDGFLQNSIDNYKEG